MKIKILLPILILALNSLLFAGDHSKAPAKKTAFFNGIVLPVVDLVDVELLSCVHLSICRAAELGSELDPQKRGYKIHPIPKDFETFKITYQARNTKLSIFLTELAKQAKLDLYITSAGIVFTRPGKQPFANDTNSKNEIWSTLYKVSK